MPSDANTLALLQPQKIAFQTKKALSATLKIKNWVALLQDLAIEDEAIVGKTKRINNKTSVIGTLFAVVIVIVIFTKFYWLLLLLVLPFAYYVKLETNKESLKKIDIENHFRLYALPLLRILAEESSENQKLKLSLDCNMPEQTAYQISENATNKAVYPHFTNTHFRLTWLDAQLELADNSFLHIKITDDIRKVVRVRRNPRGKTKYKTKRKISQTIAIKISFDKAKYSLRTAAAATEETPSHFTFKLKSQMKEKTTNTNLNFDNYNDVQPLLQLLSKAYASVQPI